MATFLKSIAQGVSHGQVSCEIKTTEEASREKGGGRITETKDCPSFANVRQGSEIARRFPVAC
jgi:hypothetical protein